MLISQLILEGGLSIRLFRRKATFEEKVDAEKVPQAHAVKLRIPKKTREFIDQSLREKDNYNHINQAN